jgi:SnoaL-like domain
MSTNGSTYVEDRLQIADLITGWMHRDLAQWDKLRELFHPDGTIEITWFQGLGHDFVEASRGMGASDFRTKHMIGAPVVTFNGTKAIVETNSEVLGENVRLGIACDSHARFYDRVEKRDGVWRISHRASVYDMGTFTFPTKMYEIDAEIVNRYPREYAALAYCLDLSGFPIKRVQATKGSALEKEMKAAAQEWLAS